MKPPSESTGADLPHTEDPGVLRTALEAAIAAAEEAGALLRDELYRPEGPRGAGSYAHIDMEVERLLRDRLLGACPWNWIGEETGKHQVDGCPYWWVVDPHDGTSDFLRGHRGTAVSIALIRDRVPVLGVVHAFVFPDDRGDLIAWAEGCGPITRNGRPVMTSLRDRTLSAGEVVIVSRAAAEYPVGNGKAVAPARFRPMPSIAYRLALTAVGDGVAAVSLNAPCSWDYAAGHALLRAADGVLLDERGRAVTYTDDARSRTVACFGGAAAAAAELARRDWRTVHSGRTHTAPPPPDRRRLDPIVLDRAHGCLLGQLAGDALGSLVEFLPATAIAERYPDGIRTMRDGGTWNTIAGQPTDDSELALALARRLAADGAWNGGAVLDSYAAWYRSSPFDVGGTTAAALAAACASPGRALDAARRAARRSSQANGSLMRVSPIGIFAAGNPELAADLAARDSALTHPHPVCASACAAFTAAIAVGVVGGSRTEMIAAARAHAGRGPETDIVRDSIDRAAGAPPPDFATHQGWVLVALQNAFHRLSAGLGVAEAVTATIMCGGDTDTNAAIAGALVGASAGRSSVPAEWAIAVLTCRPMAETSAHHPRPAEYWPDDALDLAERLLLAGAAGGERVAPTKPRHTDRLLPEERAMEMGIGAVVGADRMGMTYLARIDVVHAVLLEFREGAIRALMESYDEPCRLESALAALAEEMAGIFEGRDERYFAIEWFSADQLGAHLLQEGMLGCDAGATDAIPRSARCFLDTCVADVVAAFEADNPPESFRPRAEAYLRRQTELWLGLPAGSLDRKAGPGADTNAPGTPPEPASA